MVTVGSMRCNQVREIIHLLTIDPNFQRDIQVKVYPPLPEISTFRYPKWHHVWSRRYPPITILRRRYIFKWLVFHCHVLVFRGVHFPKPIIFDIYVKFWVFFFSVGSCTFIFLFLHWFLQEMIIIPKFDAFFSEKIGGWFNHLLYNISVPIIQTTPFGSLFGFRYIFLKKILTSANHHHHNSQIYKQSFNSYHLRSILHIWANYSTWKRWWL